MAKIIYGVAGEGFGHSSRSHLIGQHLIDAGHEVLFVASRKSLAYLRKHFGDQVKEIAGLSLAYQGGNLMPFRTLSMNLSRFSANRRTNLDLYRRVFEPFRPDLVITDFEPFSAWWAWRNRVPFISIDHQHMLTMCQLERPPGQWLARAHAEIVTQCHYVGAAAYIVLSFFRAPVTHRRAILAPPAIRPVVQSIEPTSGDHIVVYTTDNSWKGELVALLNSLPSQQFHIYGFDQARQLGNCELKKTSTSEFLRDLAGARGVIATAGFSLLSECLHFRKKMLLLPIRGQYEQIVNARYAQRLGLALYCQSLDAATLTEYMDTLREPIHDRDDILWPDNQALFEVIARTLESVLPGGDRSRSAIPVTGRVVAGWSAL